MRVSNEIAPLTFEHTTRGENPMTRNSARRARWIVLGLVLLPFGCDGPPAAPSPPAEPEPVEAAASVDVQPRTVQVGDFASITYRLSAPLPYAVDVPREATSPTGETNQDTVDFPIGETIRRFSSGIYTPDFIGTWTVRIIEDRLPDGVVLGSPASVTWTVVP